MDKYYTKENLQAMAISKYISYKFGGEFTQTGNVAFPLRQGVKIETYPVLEEVLSKKEVSESFKNNIRIFYHILQPYLRNYQYATDPKYKNELRKEKESIHRVLKALESVKSITLIIKAGKIKGIRVQNKAGRSYLAPMRMLVLVVPIYNGMHAQFLNDAGTAEISLTAGKMFTELQKHLSNTGGYDWVLMAKNDDRSSALRMLADRCDGLYKYLQKECESEMKVYNLLPKDWIGDLLNLPEISNYLGRGLNVNKTKSFSIELECIDEVLEQSDELIKLLSKKG